MNYSYEFDVEGHTIVKEKEHETPEQNDKWDKIIRISGIVIGFTVTWVAGLIGINYWLISRLPFNPIDIHATESPISNVHVGFGLMSPAPILLGIVIAALVAYGLWIQGNGD